MSAILLKLLPWYVAVLLLTGAGAWWYGHHTGYDTGASTWQVELAKRNAQIAQERETASEAARKAEHAHAAAMAAAYDTYEENLKNAKTTSDRLVADLRAGNVKLRDNWNRCVASAVVPDPAVSSGKTHATTEFRTAIEKSIFEGIAGQIRDSAEADATIRALQAVVKADRQATAKKN